MDTERIYQGEDAQWYFHVRGNQQMGPFATNGEAEAALDAHVAACRRRLELTSLLPSVLAPFKGRRQAATRPRHP